MLLRHNTKELPQVRVRGVRNVHFLENLACFVFLKHPFRDSLFCFITDGSFKEKPRISIIRKSTSNMKLYLLIQCFFENFYNSHSVNDKLELSIFYGRICTIESCGTKLSTGSKWKLILRKIPKFHLISWCWKFMKTLRQQCIFIKFPNQELGKITGSSIMHCPKHAIPFNKTTEYVAIADIVIEMFLAIHIFKSIQLNPGRLLCFLWFHFRVPHFDRAKILSC